MDVCVCVVWMTLVGWGPPSTFVVNIPVLRVHTLSHIFLRYSAKEEKYHPR